MNAKTSPPIIQDNQAGKTLLGRIKDRILTSCRSNNQKAPHSPVITSKENNQDLILSEKMAELNITNLAATQKKQCSNFNFTKPL